MISVIIPAYNVAPFICEAVASALAQTRSDIEVIVVDDGSTDGTSEALRDIKDPRLRVIRQEQSGSAAARNTGLRTATGEFVAFLDGDDFWAPQNLERQVDFLGAHPAVGMTFGHSRVVDENGRDMGYTQFHHAGVIPFSLLLETNGFGNGSCAVLRRETLDQAGPFDTEQAAYIDLDVWLRVASQRPGNVVAIGEILTYYRRRSGQITSDWRRMELAYMQMMRKLRRIAPQEVSRQERRGRASQCRFYARLAHGNGERWYALALMMVAFCWAPLWVIRDRRTWAIGLAVAAGCLLPRAFSRWLEQEALRLLGASHHASHKPE